MRSSGFEEIARDVRSVDQPVDSERFVLLVAVTLRPTRDADPGQFENVGQWSEGRCRSGAAARDDPTSHRGGNQALFSRTFVNTERTGSGRSAADSSDSSVGLQRADIERAVLLVR